MYLLVQVCEIVKEAYGDAYLTAHFEVPGEMFTLAMAARRRGMGVVGSTSNILDYIASKVGTTLATRLELTYILLRMRYAKQSMLDSLTRQEGSGRGHGSLCGLSLTVP